MRFHLTDLKIYEDGKVDCWELMSFEKFKEKVMSGWVRTTVPDGSTVSIFPLGNFVVWNTDLHVKETELIKHVKDIIRELQGKPTSSDICRKIFEEYNKKPSDKNKERLRKAYENIPEHNRVYVLHDMDNKDYPIKRILYNDEN